MLKAISQRWYQIVLQRCALPTIDDLLLLAGDGIKICKEAEKMPAVKRLHQESDNSGKAPHIHGHHWGVIGILAGWVKKRFCVPLCAELHEGEADIRRLQNKADPILKGRAKVSVTTLMATMAADLVVVMGKRCLLVLDAFFAVGPVFKILKKAVDADGQRLVHIVTRAKSNAVAYDDPPAKTGGRGRSRMNGPKLKLMTLFESRAASFEQTATELYGCRKTVSFLCLDLIWKSVGEKLRFVLVMDGTERLILMCSD